MYQKKFLCILTKLATRILVKGLDYNYILFLLFMYIVDRKKVKNTKNMDCMFLCLNLIINYYLIFL